MSNRLIILLVVLVLAFAIMVMVANPVLNWGNLALSALFCCAMIGIIYLHAKRKKEVISGGTHIFYSVVASLACSVAFFIILHVVLTILGLNLFDLIDKSYTPAGVFVTAALCFPVFWRVLK